MDWLIGQLVVVGRGPDGEESGWMQLLVFIVLAVFWAIGGIIKARASKSQGEKEPEKGKTRPQPRSRPSLERLLKTGTEKPRPRPTMVKASAKQPPAKQPVTVRAEEYQYAEISPLEIEEPRPILEAELQPQTATRLTVMEGPGVEIGTSEQLRAAILHYEIFGKCVALRGSQEQIWMR